MQSSTAEKEHGTSTRSREESGIWLYLKIKLERRLRQWRSYVKMGLTLNLGLISQRKKKVNWFRQIQEEEKLKLSNVLETLKGEGKWAPYMSLTHCRPMESQMMHKKPAASSDLMTCPRQNLFIGRQSRSACSGKYEPKRKNTYWYRYLNGNRGQIKQVSFCSNHITCSRKVLYSTRAI